MDTTSTLDKIYSILMESVSKEAVAKLETHYDIYLEVCKTGRISELLLASLLLVEEKMDIPPEEKEEMYTDILKKLLWEREEHLHV